MKMINFLITFTLFVLTAILLIAGEITTAIAGIVETICKLPGRSPSRCNDHCAGL